MTAMVRIIGAGLLALLAGPASAESLCGVQDDARLVGSVWQAETHIAFVTAADDGVGQGGGGDVELDANSRLSFDLIENLAGAGATVLLADEGMIYNVDDVDDILETTETPWMADELSDTPCGPEELPQLTGRVDYAPDLTGQVTLIGYFDDRALLLGEYELRGDWGLAFVTSVSLLTRLDQGPGRGG